LESIETEHRHGEQFAVIAILGNEGGPNGGPHGHLVWGAVRDYCQNPRPFFKSDVGHHIRACLSETLSLVLLGDSEGVYLPFATSNKVFEVVAL